MSESVGNVQMTSPAAYEDIIFASATTNINAIVAQLKRHELSVKNRLQSIVQDAQFVEGCADELDLPLIANERCGSWYIRPERKAGSAYFKSTDGHFVQWSFSLRRLNLQLLDIIRQGNGCVYVSFFVHTILIVQMHNSRQHTPWKEYARCLVEDSAHMDSSPEQAPFPRPSTISCSMHSRSSGLEIRARADRSQD